MSCNELRLPDGSIKGACLITQEERDQLMVNLDKTGLVAEVELRDKDSGAHIGDGHVERTKSGYVIVHVDLSKIPEFAAKGFTIGPISVREME